MAGHNAMEYCRAWLLYFIIIISIVVIIVIVIILVPGTSDLVLGKISLPWLRVYKEFKFFVFQIQGRGVYFSV